MMSNMMAKTVTVRELKARVGALVARAAAGERIIVTRYGTPRALLTSCGRSDPHPPSRRAKATRSAHDFDREQRAFDRLFQQGRLDAHRGRYVAVYRGIVADVDADARTLVQRLGGKLGRRVFFVGFVGSEEPLVDLPGQEMR